MADEAKVSGDIDGVFLKSYAVANGTAIAQGSLLVAGDGVATKHSAATEAFVGIAAKGKDASDGQVRLAVWPRGCGAEVTFTADGDVAAGDLIILSGTANRVTGLDLSEGGYSPLRLKGVVGQAIETASDGETFKGVLI